MTNAPVLVDDRGRVAALRELEILDTPLEDRFDRITRLAARVFDVPIVLVTLVDEHRVWFKSRVGLDLDQTTRVSSFCSLAITGSSTLIVEDARFDERWFENELASGPPFARFYAGHPLMTAEGFRVGTLCLIDERPRQFDERDRGTLVEFAAMVEAELRQREVSRGLQRQQEVEERLRVVTESVADIVVAIDVDGYVVFANHSACEMFGNSSAAPLVGRAVSSLVCDRSPAEIAMLLSNAEAGDTSNRLEVLACSTDGATVPLELTFGQARLDGRRVYIASGRDLTESRGARRKIEQINQQQQLILASTAEGIVQIDFDGFVVYANPSAHRMLRMTDNSLPGKHLHWVVHPVERDGNSSPWDTCSMRDSLVEGRIVANQRDRYWRADGTTFDVAFTAAPIKEMDVVTGAVVVLADITEQAAIERSKDEFVSLVSHELRTPLTSLKGSIGLVSGGVYGTMSSGAQAMLDLAVTNTDRLIRLVNDILDLHRVDAGRMQLHVQRHALGALVDSAIVSVNAVFAARGVHLTSQFGTDRDARIRCDGDRIVQVLTNLLSNAVKFSPQGSMVKISVDDAPKGRGDVVVIEVADEGRGIPAQCLDRVFERFEQVDSEDARHGNGSGLGLGLAISKALVEQHDGHISVSSVLGYGSTFSVELPVAGPMEVSL